MANAQNVTAKTSVCHLCGQLRGDPHADLINALLTEEGGADVATAEYSRRVILESGSFAVIPSLGALGPTHCLLCPKSHALSFAGLDSLLQEECTLVRQRLRALLLRVQPGYVFQFEHGSPHFSKGRLVCSVAHAHLHFLSVAQNFNVIGESGLIWKTFDGSLADLARRTEGVEYLSLTTPDGIHHFCRAAEGAKKQAFNSQILRRLFASRLGLGERWNWREHPDARRADAIWRTLSAVVS